MAPSQRRATAAGRSANPKFAGSTSCSTEESTGQAQAQEQKMTLHRNYGRRIDLDGRQTSGSRVRTEKTNVPTGCDRQTFPFFQIVGLPDTAVQEARERVRAAIKNSGGKFPGNRITVNLAPADLKKEGPSYDLALAVGILAAAGQIDQAQVEGSLYLGELSFEGTLRHTQGILPMVMAAREHTLSRVFVPEVNAAEAALVSDVDVIGVSSLVQLVQH